MGEPDDRDHDLLASKAVTWAQQPRQPFRDGDEQLVADLMPMRVIDLLESIEIQGHHRGYLPRATFRAERMLEQLQHQDSVGQSGQGIVQRRFTCWSDES